MGHATTTLALAILAAASTQASAASPAPLAPGQQLRGEITSADLLNWRDGSRSELYAIRLDAGQAVRFSVEGPLSAQLSLYLDEQLVQASDDGRDEASLSVRAEKAGRYVLAVSGRDAASYGPFTLSATPMQVYGGGSLAAGTTITDWAREPRSIPLDITEAGAYRIRMASEDFDTVLSLEGNGVALRSDDADGSNSMLTTILAPGRYTLLASGYHDRVDGQYELSVQPYELPSGVGPAAGGDLVPNADVTALYQGRPVDYRLRVGERSLVEIEMRSGEIDSGLVLEGNGVQLADDDSGNRLDARIATVLQPGEYTVRASAYDEGAGVFTLSARTAEVPADAGGGSLEVGRSRDARLMPGATDTWTFRIARAGNYRIDMGSEEGVDSFLRLHRDGELVAMDDDGGGSLDARIEQQLEPGEYTLEASSAMGGEGGRYRIGVTRR